MLPLKFENSVKKSFNLVLNPNKSFEISVLSPQNYLTRYELQHLLHVESFYFQIIICS